jgi:hypothetical protein
MFALYITSHNHRKLHQHQRPKTFNNSDPPTFFPFTLHPVSPRLEFFQCRRLASAGRVP